MKHLVTKDNAQLGNLIRHINYQGFVFRIDWYEEEDMEEWIHCTVVEVGPQPHFLMNNTCIFSIKNVRSIPNSYKTNEEALSYISLRSEPQ